MAHANAYGKRYDVCHRTRIIIAKARAMLRVLAEALSEHERAYAPGGAEHVVAWCGWCPPCD